MHFVWLGWRHNTNRYDHHIQLRSLRLASVVGYSGTVWVDLWIGAQVAGNVLTNAGCPGGAAFSLNDGRTNFARLNAASTRGTATAAVAALGAGWYIPSYGEGVRGAGAYTTAFIPSTVLNAAGANTWPAGINWNAGEPNGFAACNEGCMYNSVGSWWNGGTTNDLPCSSAMGVVAVWRP